MRVYIAGPYTQGNTEDNVRNAIEAADKLAAAGHLPFIPHLTHYWHAVKPHTYEFWLDQDLQWLSVCDAVFRLPGFSPGADREEEYAKEYGIPVIKDISVFLE